MSWGRAGLSAILLLALTVAFHTVSHGEKIPIHIPLSGFPRTIGAWQGQDVRLDPRLTDTLKADDMLTRVYTGAGLPTVGLFIAYFQSQRQGETIHSPKNCLPGSGWSPLKSQRETVDLGGGQQVHLNRYIIENGLDRQLVLYWYESHGRTVASEYAAKMDMVVGAIKLNRTDGALIRIAIPIEGESESDIERVARGFLGEAYPRIKEHIPQ
jgi:EpsI family protein